MAVTRLFTPRPYDSFDPAIAGVSPILATGTDVDNTKLTAVQAAAVAAGLGTLPTSAGGTAPTPVAEPLRFRGAWQASTVYSYGDVVINAGVQYVAPTSFTSGGSFVSANWTRLGTYDGTDPGLNAAYALPRAALPRQRLAGKKTIITTFQAGHGATSGGTGTVNLNDTTSPAITGYSQYVSITTNGAGATATVRKSGIASIDLTANDLEVLVKMDHPESTYLECVTTGTSFADFYTFPLNDYTLGATTRYMRANELTTLRFSLDTIAPSSGTPAKTLNAIQLGARDNGAQVGRVELYGIYAVPKPNSTAIVTISFDDLYTSQHDFALPLLAQLGFPATFYAIADRTPAQWTVAQLQDAQRLYGIEVAGHAYTTANHNTGYANLDPATRAVELANLRSWIVTNGFNGADHLAYPGGNHDATTEADVAKLYSTAVTTENSPLAEIQPAEPMRWRRKLVQSGDSVASVQALVDKAVATKSYLHLNFHDLVTSGASGPNYLKADFTTLMNYVAASGARVLTVGDVWRLGA